MPDATWGDCGVAVATSADGQTRDANALVTRLKDRLATDKGPRDILFVEGIHKSGFRKTAKETVRVFLEAWA